MSGVRLAAMMPATRATARTSPFGSVPAAIRSRTCSDSATRPRATARRRVAGFPPTSIIRISPMRREVYGVRYRVGPRHALDTHPRRTPGADAVPGMAHTAVTRLWRSRDLLAHDRPERAGIRGSRAALRVAAGVAAAEAHADHAAGRGERRHLVDQMRKAPSARRGEVDPGGVLRVDHVAVEMDVERRVVRQAGEGRRDVIGDHQPRAGDRVALAGVEVAGADQGGPLLGKRR